MFEFLFGRKRRCVRRKPACRRRKPACKPLCRRRRRCAPCSPMTSFGRDCRPRRPRCRTSDCYVEMPCPPTIGGPKTIVGGTSRDRNDLTKWVYTGEKYKNLYSKVDADMPLFEAALGKYCGDKPRNRIRKWIGDECRYTCGANKYKDPWFMEGVSCGKPCISLKTYLSRFTKDGKIKKNPLYEATNTFGRDCRPRRPKRRNCDYPCDMPCPTTAKPNGHDGKLHREDLTKWTCSPPYGVKLGKYCGDKPRCGIPKYIGSACKYMCGPNKYANIFYDKADKCSKPCVSWDQYAKNWQQAKKFWKIRNTEEAHKGTGAMDPDSPAFIPPTSEFDDFWMGKYKDHQPSFGRRRKCSRKTTKCHKKLPKAIVTKCRKLKIKTTIKRGSRRVPRSLTLLKRLIARKMRRCKKKSTCRR